MTAYERNTSRALVSTLLDYTKRQRVSVETRPSCDGVYCWIILQSRQGQREIPRRKEARPDESQNCGRKKSKNAA